MILPIVFVAMLAALVAAFIGALLVNLSDE